MRKLLLFAVLLFAVGCSSAPTTPMHPPGKTVLLNGTKCYVINSYKGVDYWTAKVLIVNENGNVIVELDERLLKEVKDD